MISIERYTSAGSRQMPKDLALVSRSTTSGDADGALTAAGPLWPQAGFATASARLDIDQRPFTPCAALAPRGRVPLPAILGDHTASNAAVWSDRQLLATPH